MSASVFISYASQDQKVASTLCKALEGRGYPCWIAARDIAPGENFQISIVRAIRSAKIMLLVFTGNSNNSEEMAKELALASQSRLIVVPLRIEDVRQNDAFAYEFATRQWIDFFADWETAMEQLAQRISVALATAPTPTAPASATAPAGQPGPTPDVIAEAIAAQPAEAAAARSPTLVDPAGKTAVLSAAELATAATGAGPSSFQSSETRKRGAPVMLFVAIGVLLVVAVAGAAVIAPSFLKKPAPPPAPVAVAQPQAPALSITPAPPPNPALVTQPTAVSPAAAPLAAGHTPIQSASSSRQIDEAPAQPTSQADSAAQEDPDLDPETHPGRAARFARRHPGAGRGYGGGGPDVPF